MRIDHPDRDLLGHYAMGSLDEVEARRVREHVRGCGDCQDLLRRDESLLGDLATLVPPVEPPDGLEDAVMRRIGALPVSFERRGTGGRYAVMAAVAVLVIALAAGNIVQWFAHSPPKSAQVVPGLSLIVLVGRESSADAYGTVVLDPLDNGGVLAVRGLARLDATHVYQLWLYRNHETRSGGTFSVSEDGYGNLLLEVPKDFRNFSSISITREPRGGSAAPSGTVVAQGEPARP